MLRYMFRRTENLAEELAEISGKLKELNKDISDAEYNVGIASGSTKSAVPYQAHEEVKARKRLTALQKQRNYFENKFNKISDELDLRRRKALVH